MRLIGGKKEFSRRQDPKELLKGKTVGNKGHKGLWVRRDGGAGREGMLMRTLEDSRPWERSLGPNIPVNKILFICFSGSS